MKKFISIVIMLMVCVMFINVAEAGDVTVKMSNWKFNSDVSIDADFLVFNNTPRYISYFKISIILLDNGKIVGSQEIARISGIPVGGFISVWAWFKGASSFTHYKWSLNGIGFK